jgi:hypothetical protein
VVIVGSLLLILVAVGLLVAGVLSGSNVLIILSILATVIAAVILIIGVRQSASDEDEDDGDDEPASASRSGRDSVVRESRAGARRSESYGGAETETETTPAPGATMVDAMGSIPTQVRERDTDEAPTSVGSAGAESGTGPYEAAESVVEMDDDPPGEPSAQVTSPADAAQIAPLSTEVLVVDGRPRYHLAGCVHLLGRDSEPLPVSEALELGFTPCGMCEPDSSLLAEARQD